MKVRATIEPKSAAEFQKAMSDLANMSRETLVDIGLKQAQLICRDMMAFTPPLAAGGSGGLAEAGRKAGARAVERDIRKLFVAMDGKGTAPVFLFQQNLALAVKANNSAQFDSLIRGANRKVLGKLSPVLQKICSDYDLDRAMRKARNYLAKSNPQKGDYGDVGFTKRLQPFHQAMLDRTGGRFSKNGRSFNPLGSWTNKQIVLEDATIVEYISKRQAHVGRLKAGWWDALQLIPNPKPNGTEREYGRAGVGDWIKAQASGQGRFSMAKGTSKVNLTISNMIGDLNNVSTDADVKSTVLGLRTANIQRDLEDRVRKMVERANKKAIGATATVK